MMQSAPADVADDELCRRTALTLLAGFGAAWFLHLLTSRYPGYVHHDTTEVLMWSEVGWPLGFDKHPPFLPWLVRAVGMVMPMNAVTLAMLSAANITVGAWAVWRIAAMTAGECRAIVALCLYGLSPSVTVMALKLNHNSILVSLWPLIALAFLVSLRRPTVVNGALFAVAAAAGALAKYYSMLLLVACFLASLASTERARYYRRPAPYVTIVLFTLLVAPNLKWLATHDMQSMAYAFRELTHPLRRAAHFALLAPVVVLPMVIAFFGYRYLIARRARDGRDAAHWSLAMAPELIVLAITPYVLTILLTLVMHLQGSSTWAMPAFSLVPVLLAGFAGPLRRGQIMALQRAAMLVLGLVVLSGPVSLVSGFASGFDGAIEPRIEAANDGAAIWKAALDGQPRLVAGNDRWASAATLALAGHPLVWTSYSFERAPWVTPEAIRQHGILLLCHDGEDGCAQTAATYRGATTIHGCAVPRQRSLLWLKGPVFVEDIWIVAPAGRLIEGAKADAACRAAGGMVKTPG